MVHTGRVVWDVCSAVVHVLDLWVQGSMAHQVSFFTLDIRVSLIASPFFAGDLGHSSFVRAFSPAACVDICGLVSTNGPVPDALFAFS